MSELWKRIEEVKRRGAYIEETSTGRTTRRHTWEMVRDALPHLKKGLSSVQAAANARGHGRPPKKRATAKEDAERHWFDLRSKTNKLALKQMTGWTMSAAYDAFGPSERPRRGRPREKK